jgi:hypothetical protein
MVLASQIWISEVQAILAFWNINLKILCCLRIRVSGYSFRSYCFYVECKICTHSLFTFMFDNFTTAEILYQDSILIRHLQILFQRNMLKITINLVVWVVEVMTDKVRYWTSITLGHQVAKLINWNLLRLLCMQNGSVVSICTCSMCIFAVIKSDNISNLIVGHKVFLLLTG